MWLVTGITKNTVTFSLQAKWANRLYPAYQLTPLSTSPEDIHTETDRHTHTHTFTLLYNSLREKNKRSKYIY